MSVTIGAREVTRVVSDRYRSRHQALVCTVFLAFTLFSSFSVEGRPTSTENESLEKFLFSEEQAKEFGARCLDGTPSGYFYKSGSDPSGFVLFLEGGGYCHTEDDCTQRSKSQLGSSKKWESSAQFTGLLSFDPDVNPDFHTWSKVYIPYCCGDLHSGTRRQNDVWNLYFAGHLTVSTVIGTLKNTTSIAQAKNILLSGGSAGGIGTFEHANYVREQFPNTTVKATPIGGFFFPGNPQNYSAFVNNEPAAPRNSSILDLYQSRVDDKCAAANPSQPWQCGPANVAFLFPYIETPIFVGENRFDTNQIFTQMHCPRERIKSVDEYVIYYGKSMRQAMNAVINSPRKAGLYFPACLQHTGNLQNLYKSRPINATTYGQSLADWYFGRGEFPHQLLEEKTIPDC